jgi:hypothetical protein
MAIVLNHTIVPAHDKAAPAEACACAFGHGDEGRPHAHFAPVRVKDGLTLDLGHILEILAA